MIDWRRFNRTVRAQERERGCNCHPKLTRVPRVPWTRTLVRVAHRPGCPRRTRGQVATLSTIPRTGSRPATTTGPTPKPRPAGPRPPRGDVSLGRRYGNVIDLGWYFAARRVRDSALRPRASA